MSRLRRAVFRVRGAYHLGRAIASGESWGAGAAPAPLDPVEAQTDTDDGPLLGVVEHFTRSRVSGWVSVPAEQGPVTVTLQVNRLVVAETTAEPAPAQLRRNSWDQVRQFEFAVQDLWDYVGAGDRITVRSAGQVLPIAGRGVFRRAGKQGAKTVDELADRLDAGWTFTQKGGLHMPLDEDLDWQRAALDLYGRVRELVAGKHGAEVFFTYGTLLGAVREGGFIGADHDLDAGYLSERPNGPEAAAELLDVAATLIDAGLQVRSYTTHLAVRDDSDAAVDLFHFFWHPDGTLAAPFGVAGTSPLTKDGWAGTREVELGPGRGLVPAEAEAFVEHLYGPDWRTPDPNWTWNRDRAEKADDAVLTSAQTEEIYWAAFYSRASYSEPSTFCQHVLERDDVPQTVLDLGCGDGRDSVGFARSGRNVFGADRSHVGVRHANEKAAALPNLRFVQCDVSNAAQVGGVIDEAVAAAGDEPLLFYMRFFLHSIPEEAQATLLSAIAARARTGDLFAAEFRTDKDESNHKVHTDHYRRFQNAAGFSAALTGEYGFSVLEEVEGTGFAPYRDEDPVVYRVVARRP